MIPEVGGGGLGFAGPRGKGSLSDANGPKPSIQLLQLLKNSPKEVKRVQFGIYRVPPGPTQEMKLMGPGGKGPSRPPPPPVSPAMMERILYKVSWLALTLYHMPRYPFNVSASVHYFRGMHCLYHPLTSRFALDASMKLLILSFFPHPNYYQKTLLISQSLVCLCHPYLYDQATYGINHTEVCCECRYL